MFSQTNTIAKKDLKVLVISHNVFSATSSMGRTLANFFDGIPSENIAQLYFHSEVPTLCLCKKYYRITDFDLIKKSKKNVGQQFSENDIFFGLKSERNHSGMMTKIYNHGKKKKPYMYIIRNLLWATGRWNKTKVFEWVDEFKPNVIFFASGDYVFAYNIATQISKHFAIPIVTYICDDYYFLNRSSISPLYFTNMAHYKFTLRRFFSQNKKVVAISDKITQDYKNEFDIDSTTIMTSSEQLPYDQSSANDVIKISYIGNLDYNRYLSIMEIGRAVKAITDGQVMVDVYSAENRNHILQDMVSENGIKFNGSVSYEEVVKVMHDSDILIHAESFDTVNRKRVKYSVSTKIADSLSMGKCLFAYGPEDVASMEYLNNNSCACVVTKSDDLKSKLENLMYDEGLRKQYMSKAKEVAKENHNKITNGKVFIEVLRSAMGDLDNEGVADQLRL